MLCVTSTLRDSFVTMISIDNFAISYILLRAIQMSDESRLDLGPHLLQLKRNHSRRTRGSQTVLHPVPTKVCLNDLLVIFDPFSSFP